MNKILSVCIPSYNMEAYLSRNIDSFIAASEVLEKLEIIIVNDGSKDHTLDIANSYKALYPDSIIVIDKPNGHYGSCVNASLKIATGKYFRIVDADDWVDPKALITVIRTLENVDADVVYTQYSTYRETDGRAHLEEDASEMKWNQLLCLNDFIFNKYLHMHQLTYRLNLLIRINYRQTEGVCYTDTEYDFIPFVNAQSIYCIPVSLYQYYVGREDQSMAPEVIASNFKHLYKVLDSIVNYIPKDVNANYAFQRKTYIDALLGYIIDAIFINYGENDEWNVLLRNMFDKLLSQGVDLSNYWERKFWGLSWIYLLYKNDLLSRLKLKLLFSALKIRKAF